jgi:hypothetical protein
MVKTEQILIEHHLSSEELLKRIKSLEKDTRVLQRLYFVKYRYEDVTVEEAANFAEISKPITFFKTYSIFSKPIAYFQNLWHIFKTYSIFSKPIAINVKSDGIKMVMRV